MNNNSIILSLETTISGGSLSLLKGIREIDFNIGSNKTSQAEQLISEIDEILYQNKIEKKQIDLITVSDGFGSLTGARIGLAIAKGIGKSIGCKIKKVSLLEAMCLSASETGKFLVCIQKRKNEICFQKFQRRSDRKILELTTPNSMSLESFLELSEKGLEEQLIFESYLYKKVKNSFENKFSKSEKNMFVIRADENLSKYIGIRGRDIIASDNDLI